LGHLLIETVVKQLQNEFPNLSVFSTLSPIPRFRTWLETALNQVNDVRNKKVFASLLTEAEKSKFRQYEKDGEPHAVFKKILDEEKWPSDNFLQNLVRRPLERLAARFLMTVKKQGFAFDPVANFHFRNGARLESINWLADPSKKRLTQSYGIMVNYRYILADLKNNNKEYLIHQCVAVSQKVQAICERDC